MSNGKSGEADKGSRKSLQLYVNERQRELNELIISAAPTLLAFGAESIEWKSPLKKEQSEYNEYRDRFLQALGLDESLERQVRAFWPRGGPQWDGLAVVHTSTNRIGYLLVEAKAHPAETMSNSGASDAESVSKIKQAFAATQAYMGVSRRDWMNGYYQLGNRLAFLYLMNIELKLSTWLVLVNFVGDTSHIPTDLQTWIRTEREMFAHLGLQPDSPLIGRIVSVHPQVH